MRGLSGKRLKGRYELGDVVGRGGMGVVYRAVDLETQSEVAIKTVEEVRDSEQLELFRKECAVLRKLRHTNVIDLYDYGVLTEGESSAPFFVMPLLPGASLETLIKSSSVPLTTQRVVDIIAQICRGLQAAHDIGLVHRDVKPSNIFVLDDDAAKLIDFGVVHLVDQRSAGFRGTLAYASPEQIEMKVPTAVSDVFSVGVVCYEALTRRHPFPGKTDEEIARGILHVVPPSVSDLNPTVSLALSQVVQAAMAKKPSQRTPTARQFGEELQKALHNQTIDRFDPARIEPRIRRAKKALEEAEYDFAGEILGELEAEGHVQPELRSLRQQVNVGLRSKTVAHLLEGARRRFEQDEYPLALQKVDEVIGLDPGNEQALSLRAEIEAKSKTEQISNWLRLASDHLNNYRFGHARQALQDVLRLRSTDSSALQMFSEVDRREADYLRQKQEKDSLYRQALDCWKRGEVSSALSKLGRVLELDRQAPDLQVSSEAISYQSLYSQVRSEHEALKNAHAEARKFLSEANFDAASSICSEHLQKYPDNALFEALRFELEEKQRQYISSYIGKVDREVESEPDLDRKVGILTEAGRRYPNETHFRERLESVTRRRDLLHSIVQRARNFEDRGEYSEALSQWDILRTIYPDYPGIQLEIERVGRRRDHQLISDSKARWVEQIDHALHSNDFVRALEVLKSALSEFPADPELTAQERIAQKGAERSQEAVRRFDEAQALYEQNPVEGLDSLRAASSLDTTNPVIRASFVEALLRRASGIIDSDSPASENLIREVLTLEPGNVKARNLQRILADRNQESGVQLALSNSRSLEEQGNVDDALQEIENGLTLSRSDPRLNTRKDALLKRKRRDPAEAGERDRDIAEMLDLTARFQTATDLSTKDSMFDRSLTIVTRHKGDPDIEAIFRELESLQNGQQKETGTSEPVEFQEPTYPSHTNDPAQSRGETEPTGNDRVDLGRVPKVLLLRLQGLAQSIGTRNLALLLGVLAVTIAGVVIYGTVFSEPTRVAKVEATMAASSSVAGATIYVDNAARGISPQKVTLEEGVHELEARLPGYRSVPATFRVSADANLPAAVNLELEPLPSTLSLHSQDFAQAKIDEEIVKLNGAVLRKPALSEGHHKVELSSQAGPIVIEFESRPGELPVIRQLSSASVAVAVISYLEDKAEVRFAGDPKGIPKTAGISNSRQPVVDRAGRFEGLVRGSNVVELETSAGVQSVGIEVDANPAIAIVVGADLNVGNLKVMSSVEGARVSVVSDDKKITVPAKQIVKGNAVFVGLQPKAYTVTIEAEGYSPGLGQANVSRNRVSMLLINLSPLPKHATLVVTGGTAGATIRMAGRAPLTLDPTGGLPKIELDPGPQTISISKDDYETKEIKREFVAGETLVLSDAEAALVPYGSLKFSITTPPSPNIGYRPDRSPSPPLIKVRNNDSVKVQQGRYVISIESTGFESRNETVQVTPGKDTLIGGTLNPILVVGPSPPPAVPKSPPRTEKDLEGQRGTSNGWTSGGDLLMLKEKLPGDYSFTLKADKGVASFYLNCSDKKTYVEYVIREEYILRKVSPNSGQGRAFTDAASKVPKKDVYPVRISVLERQARIFVNDKLVATDEDFNFLQGYFCFPPKQSFKDFKFEQKR
jgi:eukaryotic-like serine/threonine-protein kinase